MANGSDGETSITADGFVGEAVIKCSLADSCNHETFGKTFEGLRRGD